MALVPVEGPRMIEPAAPQPPGRPLQALQALPVPSRAEPASVQRHASPLQHDHRLVRATPVSTSSVSNGRSPHSVFRDSRLSSGGHHAGQHAAAAAPLHITTERQLRALFDRCDCNHDNMLNKRELIKICRSDPAVADFFDLPHHISQEDGTRDAVERRFQGIDINSDRQISWEEFRNWFAHTRRRKPTDPPHAPVSQTHGRGASPVTHSHSARPGDQRIPFQAALPAHEFSAFAASPAGQPFSPRWSSTSGGSLRPEEMGSVTHSEAQSQEVAVREVELRVLRAEVEAKEHEALMLRERLRDADFSVLEASGTVEALSAKVETKAGNQNVLLEASAKQIDSQVVILRRKLAQMEWDLAEKDEDIAKLQRALNESQGLLGRQKGELGILMRSQDEQGHQVAQLARNAAALQRAKAVGEWRDRVHAKIEQETSTIALRRRCQEYADEMHLLDEETATCRAFISRMEETCRRHAAELERYERRYESLKMEERLCTSAAQLGRETADEAKRNQLVEQHALETRIHQEGERRHTQQPGARSYESHEAQALSHEGELMAFTACMREISRALHSGPGGPDDTIDAAMSAFLQSSRGHGAPLPPVVRIGPSDYLIGHDLVQCVMVRGVLYARVIGGPLIPIGKFIESRRRFGGGRFHIPRTSGAPAEFCSLGPYVPQTRQSASPVHTARRPHPPVVAGEDAQRSFSHAYPRRMMAASPRAASPRSWRSDTIAHHIGGRQASLRDVTSGCSRGLMSSLVRPVSIGGAERLLTTV